LIKTGYRKSQKFITLREQLELTKIKELDEAPRLIILDNSIPSVNKEN